MGSGYEICANVSVFLDHKSQNGLERNLIASCVFIIAPLSWLDLYDTLSTPDIVKSFYSDPVSLQFYYLKKRIAIDSITY